MECPKVSVIIPFFNAAGTLDRCLASVLSQSLRQIEVLLYDDGSTDGSSRLIEKYADDRIRFFSGPNRGAGPARNRCLREARGKYVAFMDADDCYCASDSLELLYAAAENSGALITGGAHEVWEGKIFQYAGPQCELKDGFISAGEYQYNYGYHAFLYERKFLLENNIRFPSLKRYQDPPFFLEAQIEAGRVYFIPHHVYLLNFRHRAQGFYSVEKVNDQAHGFIRDLEIAVAHRFERLMARIVWRMACESENYALSWLGGNRKILNLLRRAGALAGLSEDSLPPVLRIDSCRAALAGNTDLAAMKMQAFSRAMNFWNEKIIGLEPSDIHHRIRIIHEIGRSDRQRAIGLARALSDEFPRSPLPWLHLSILAEQGGALKDAIAFIKSGIELFPDIFSMLERLFYLHLFNHEPEKAAALLARAVKCRSALPTAPARMRSGLAMSEGRSEEAFSMAVQALCDDPEDIWNSLWTYDLAMRMGKKEKALSVLARALMQFPLNEDLRGRFLALEPDDAAADAFGGLGHCLHTVFYLEHWRSKTDARDSAKLLRIQRRSYLALLVNDVRQALSAGHSRRAALCALVRAVFDFSGKNNARKLKFTSL